MDEKQVKKQWDEIENITIAELQKMGIKGMDNLNRKLFIIDIGNEERLDELKLEIITKDLISMYSDKKELFQIFMKLIIPEYLRINNDITIKDISEVIKEVALTKMINERKTTYFKIRNGSSEWSHKIDSLIEDNKSFRPDEKL